MLYVCVIVSERTLQNKRKRAKTLTVAVNSSQ